jgi:hypothetical protein
MMTAATRRGLRAAVVRYARLPRTQRAGTLEALLELVRAYVLVRILGWSRYSRTLGTAQPGDAVLTWDGDRTEEARAVGRAVDRWRRIAPGATTCLIRAIAGQRMFARRGVPSALVLGLRVSGADMKAHGWLRVGNMITIGADEVAGHHPIAHFMAGPTPPDSVAPTTSSAR